MPRFSQKSLERLHSCHPSLIELAEEAIKYTDFSVIWGYRGEKDQNSLKEQGFSDLNYPHSLHNKQPALAFDIVPYPIDWEDRERFFFLAGVVMSLAFQLDIPLRWGGAWTGKLNTKDMRDDLAHYELKEL